MPRGVYPRLAGYRPRKVDPPEVVEAVRELYAAGASQAEIAIGLRRTLRYVQGVFRRNGIAARRQVKRNQHGPLNAWWRGGRTSTRKGYVRVLAPGHPRADAEGYVFEHILVMEATLGRSLAWHGPGHPLSEIIHHENGNKADNRPSNLGLTTYSDHFDEHGRDDLGHMRAHGA